MKKYLLCFVSIITLCAYGQITLDDALTLTSPADSDKQAKVTLSHQYDEFVMHADSGIRYFINQDDHTLVIQGVIPADNTTPLQPNTLLIPYEQYNLLVEVGEPFRVALSTDERTLTLIRGTALELPEGPLGNDSRAPSIYFLSNTDPNTAAQLLRNLYSELTIVVDDRQRALYIRINVQDKPLVDNLMRLIDAPRPQVIVEAEILEINRNITQNLGINYSNFFQLQLREDAGGTLTSLGPISRSITNPFLTVGIRVLKDTGAAQTLARPRVTTLDGQEAQISATQSFPIVIKENNQNSSIQTVTTGITLRFSPKISPDGTLEAELNITVSSPTGITPEKGVPQFSTREARTTVRVANGEPIVIGGLLERRRLEAVSKVPLLGDIPLLGELLFTQRLTDERETDLVIIVTPRIIDMPDFSALQRGNMVGDLPLEEVEATTP